MSSARTHFHPFNQEQDIIMSTDYFFSGNQYIRVTRADTGPGSTDAGYPAPIGNWDWHGFGADGIDAALYSGSKCYFFKGNQYIRMTRGVTGAGSVDPGYPAPISNWNWGSFGADGIDAALYSGSKCYFFKGNQYIRVTRGDTGPGSMDPGYPAPISNWNWGSFGANGIDAALYSGSKCYFFAGKQYIRVSRSDTGPGTVDPGYPAPISNWNWNGFGANGIDAALYSGGPLVSPPSAGLGSNSNYFLYSPGAGAGTVNNLTGLSVTINVDADITGSDGFGFQVNAYSAKGDTDGAQQYLIYLSPHGDAQLTCMVDNWQSTSEQLVNQQVKLAPLPTHTLPQGYALTITLANDSNGRITAATYTASDKNGNSIGSHTITLLDLNGVTTADLAPIVAFQLNFVDYLNGGSTTLSSGNGTITYAADQVMTVSNSVPSAVDWDFSTKETANSVYGLLPAAPSRSFTQWFDIGAPGAKIDREGTVRHTTMASKV